MYFIFYLYILYILYYILYIYLVYRYGIYIFIIMICVLYFSGFYSAQKDKFMEVEKLSMALYVYTKPESWINKPKQ